jgi:hypothetical protein
MWPIAMFEDPDQRMERFQKQARPAYKRLIEGLILYLSFRKDQAADAT